jgi:hypothetical protein
VDYNNKKVLIFMVLGIIFIAIFFYYMKHIVGKVPLSRIECMNSHYKWKLVTGTSVDYVGQKATTKLDETVRFFNNPLNGIEGDDTSDIINLNCEYEEISQEQVEKQLVALKLAHETQQIQFQVTQAKQVSKEFIKNRGGDGLAYDDVSSELDGLKPFKRSNWVLLEAQKLKLSGLSLYGCSAIDVYTAPKTIANEAAPAEVEAEVKTDSDPEVEVEVDVEIEMQEQKE